MPDAVQIYLTESYSQSHHPDDIVKYLGIIQSDDFVKVLCDVVKLAHKLNKIHIQKVRNNIKVLLFPWGNLTY